MSAVTRAYFAKNNPVMIIGVGYLSSMDTAFAVKCRQS